jgi:hypothetical protein
VPAHNLTISSRSQKMLFKLLRIDSHRSMEGARQIFGSMFGIGIRNRAPKKGELPRSVHFGNIVNVVNVSLDEGINEMERFKEFTFMQGIDFIYNEICQALRIRVQYSRVEAESDIVRSEVQLNQSVLMILDNQPGMAPKVVPGVFFIRNENLVQVMSVNGHDVVVSDNNSVQYNISLNEARHLMEACVS